ncbi:MAG: hypothetical protein JWL61_1167 [Gemmatimonadetes bacterium]|jgi:hypothetical protein|nr:hypothetical protein [Gemmatimonadota bacterium]
MSHTRYLAASALALIIALSAPATAQKSGGLNVNVNVPDSVAHIVERTDPAHANYAIVTKDGTGALVLMDTTIVAQLTDRGLERLRSKVATDSIKGATERMLARMVLGALQPVFDHGIAYHLRDLASANYADDRLQLKRNNGEEIFRDLKLNNTRLMESFSPEDARAFARKVGDARARLIAR